MSGEVRLDVVLARALGEGDARDYDAFVERAGSGHYTQARPWAAVATAGRPLAPRYFLARRGGEVVGAAIVLRAMAGGLVPLPAAIVERGPVCRDVSDVKDVARAMVSALRKKGVARVTAMPYFAGPLAPLAEEALLGAGFSLAQTFDGAHARTLRIDLSNPDPFAGKDGKSLRQRVRQAERAGVTTRLVRGADLGELEGLYATLMAEQGKKPKPRAWFDAIDRALLATDRGAAIVSSAEGRPVSAAFVARHAGIVTWVIGATSPERTTAYSKMVPTVMAAIDWARSQGAHTFDLGGIPLEDDPDEKRKSIAQFKLYFAKEPIKLAREHARLF